NADGIDVSVSPYKPGDAPSSGIGGFSFSPYRVEILLDSEGFYPDFTDTSKKPHNRQKECLCRREKSIALSSSAVLLSRSISQVSAGRRSPANWVLKPMC